MKTKILAHLSFSKLLHNFFISLRPKSLATTAAIFWLKNRQPAKWRDKKEVENLVKLGDELESMSDEELAAIIRGAKE